MPLNVGRYIILLAVLGSMLAAFACLVYGAVEVVMVVTRFCRAGGVRRDAKTLSVSLLADVDLFLLGTVFYIIGVALYELFINENVPAPRWLIIHDLDDLKPKLIGGIVLILAIFFLQRLVDWDDRSDLLRLSISIAIIIAVLTFFEYATSKPSHDSNSTIRVEARPPVAVNDGAPLNCRPAIGMLSNGRDIHGFNGTQPGIAAHPRFRGPLSLLRTHQGQRAGGRAAVDG